ncbi:MAG: 4Fe-4S binding protein [Chloroflexi bacterium]|nr:4Fe-4S binding protein [Chloroflexota bacterium]
MLPHPLLWLLTTAFRLFPWPARPGLRAVGNPGSDSPVLLTGNFAITVARVERALRGLDGWLLVANSRGINVWCAAAGGHLTTHDAISALKISSVAERVAHRRVILPQLAATGIEADQVRERTGWEVVWGPVDARDLPKFLRGEKSSQMRQAHFDLQQRLEMAVMWAAPLSLLTLVTLLFWPAGFLPLVTLIWGLTLAVYLAFPLYEPLVARRNLVGFVALFGGMTLAGTALVGTLVGHLTLPFLLRWGGLGLGVTLLLAFDLAGSTPLYKSWTHAEQSHRVTLEAERCIGCGCCAQVCPRGVFTVEEIATLPHTDRCEQCGACIVQCPTDALTFTTPDGEQIPPEVIRRYKLNLMGLRTQTRQGK